MAYSTPFSRGVAFVLEKTSNFHGRKEILGLQSNQIVKRKRKLRSKLRRRRKIRDWALKRKEIELNGGMHNRTAFQGVFLSFSDQNHLDIFAN